jgi:ribosomal protein S18 acetylase RimI-like enzyme
MMTNDHVRLATSSDAAEAARLLHDFNTEFDEATPGVEALTKRIVEVLEAGAATILLGGQRPDGIAVLRFRPAIFEPKQTAYLEELYVAPARRGEGLGRALLEAAIDLARDEGASWIELGTSEDDVAARALYESAGFTNREGRPDGPVMFVYERRL